MIWRRVVALLVFSWSFLLPAGWAEKRWVRVAAVGFWGFGLLAVVLGVVMLGAEYDPEFGEWFGLRWGGNYWVTFTLFFTYYLLFLMQFGLLRLVRLSLSLSPGINLPRLLIEFCWHVCFFLITFQSHISSSLFLPISLLFPIAIVFMMVFGLGLLGTYFIKLSITSGCVLGLCCICFLFSIPFVSPFSYKYLSREYMFLSRIMFLFPILALLFYAQHLPRFLIFSEICQIGLPRESIDHQGNDTSIFLRSLGKIQDYLLIKLRSADSRAYFFVRSSLFFCLFVLSHSLSLCLLSLIGGTDLRSLSPLLTFFLLPYLGGLALRPSLSAGTMIRVSRANQFNFCIFQTITLSLISSGLVYGIIFLIRPDILSLFKGSTYFTLVALFVLGDLTINYSWAYVSPNHEERRGKKFGSQIQLLFVLILLSRAAKVAPLILATLCCLRAIYLYRTIRKGDLE